VFQGVNQTFFLGITKVLVRAGFLVKIFLMIVGGGRGVVLKNPGVVKGAGIKKGGKRPHPPHKNRRPHRRNPSPTVCERGAKPDYL
jgi:hypothetical protein